MVLTHHSKVKREVLGANDRSLTVGCSPHPAIMAPLPVLAEGPCHQPLSPQPGPDQAPPPVLVTGASQAWH